MKHFYLLQTATMDQATSGLEETSAENADQVKEWLSYLGLGEQATSIVGGILVLIIGFFVAKFVSSMIAKVVRKTGIDNKMKGGMSISKFLGKLIYFLLMLIVLMTALNIMGVGDQVLAPLNEMVTKFTSAIPNIIIAGLIIYAGYFLAKLVSEFISFSADTMESIAPKLQLPEGTDILKIIKTIVFIIIFVPILIVGLDFLNFDPITQPATGLLTQFMDAIPLIIKAAAVMLVAYFGGKLITGLLKELLVNMKVDQFADKLGIKDILGNSSLSGLIATFVFIFIVYSGVMESLNILGLDKISTVLQDVMYVAGKVLFGLLILVLGNIVANFAVNIFSKGEDSNTFLMALMKGAIIIIFLAMGLSAMDIADNIINLAFGLGMAAIAVAFALSFGLGGKDVAGEEMKKFFDKLNKKK